MNETKYRAWDTINKTMITEGLAITMDGKFSLLTSRQGDGALEHRLIKDGIFIFMQYTGLNDKNKVEIYSGDIIRFEDGVTGEVSMQFYSWVIQVKEGKHTLWDMFFDHVELEVIGNIYNNPELKEK